MHVTPLVAPPPAPPTDRFLAKNRRNIALVSDGNAKQLHRARPFSRAHGATIRLQDGDDASPKRETLEVLISIGIWVSKCSNVVGGISLDDALRPNR